LYAGFNQSDYRHSWSVTRWVAIATLPRAICETLYKSTANTPRTITKFTEFKKAVNNARL